MSAEMVNHPTHYNQGDIEVIDALEDWKLPPNLWQAVKYIARAGHKGSRLEDLRKGEWYLHREIQLQLWPDLTSKQAQTREIWEFNQKMHQDDLALGMSLAQASHLDLILGGQRLLNVSPIDRADFLIKHLIEHLRSHK